MTHPFKFILLIVLLMGAPIGLISAQELNCLVKVNADQVQTQERQVFDDLQVAIQQFMNNTKFTDDEFEDQERIECEMLITLGKKSTLTNFNAVIQVRSKRPIYGTEYQSPVLNFFDQKAEFTYLPSQPLLFSENNYTSELSALLSYYSYLIIALDYDTFSEKGGQPFYEKAFSVLNLAQGQGRSGWDTSSDILDRYWLISNLRSPQFDAYRVALYDYHRKALDFMTQKPDEARAIILEALKKIVVVRNQQTISVTLNAFFDAKSLELTNLFSQANADMRAEASEILIDLDPTNASVYRKIAR